MSKWDVYGQTIADLRAVLKQDFARVYDKGPSMKLKNTDEGTLSGYFWLFSQSWPSNISSPVQNQSMSFGIKMPIEIEIQLENFKSKSFVPETFLL